MEKLFPGSCEKTFLNEAKLCSQLTQLAVINFAANVLSSFTLRNFLHTAVNVSTHLLVDRIEKHDVIPCHPLHYFFVNICEHIFLVFLIAWKLNSARWTESREKCHRLWCGVRTRFGSERKIFRGEEGKRETKLLGNNRLIILPFISLTPLWLTTFCFRFRCATRKKFRCGPSDSSRNMECHRLSFGTEQFRDFTMGG